MRGLLQVWHRGSRLGTWLGLLLLAVAPARADQAAGGPDAAASGGPPAARPALRARSGQPITFDLSDSLELSGRPRPPGSSLRLPELDPTARTAGLDALLEQVSVPGIQLGSLAQRLTPPSPAVEPPRKAPVTAAAPPAPRLDRSMRLTTRIDRMARPLGEFKTRDWNALGDVRALDALGGADLTAPVAEPKLVLGSIGSEVAPPPLSASFGKPSRDPAAAPAITVRRVTPRPAAPEAADTTPAAMARAQASLADARAAGLKRVKPRGSSEPLFVLPDFGTSSFQVGASFSLSGRPIGRIGFSEKAGPFDGGLGARGRLLETADTLRLNDAEPVESKPRKDDDGRLWTGVVFNF